MGSFNGQVAAGNDDGYGLKDGTGSFQLTAGIILMGKSGSPYSSFFRFQNVTIAPGVTINSAKLTLYFSGGGSNNIVCKIYGIKETNTADFSSDPRSRTKTTANADWNFTDPGGVNYEFDTADFTAALQEVIDQGGWASGNAVGIRIDDNGSAFDKDCDSYEHSTVHAAKLVVTYTGSSPSSSVSPSSSLSPSPSASIPSETPVLKVAKRGKNALASHDPRDFIFHSGYGTLKYYTKQLISISFDANTGDISATGNYTHGLGYYPFCEVFVSVNGGNYEYCPFFGSGASVAYSATFIITSTQIKVYGEINGVSTDVWTFDFLVFVYKNNLQLG